MTSEKSAAASALLAPVSEAPHTAIPTTIQPIIFFMSASSQSVLLHWLFHFKDGVGDE
ncbi:hypothetical protein [Nonomuraea dietziae]|uniref:hypothetical protein n=1 Tax=Nonomuraea dietziae TaxID=65515 RepID=UPI0031CFF483